MNLHGCVGEGEEEGKGGEGQKGREGVKGRMYVKMNLFMRDKRRSYNLRMVSIGRAFKDHEIPTPCHGQGDLPLDQIIAPPNLALTCPGMSHRQ